MIFPPRCFTCGKLIGHKVLDYEQKVKEKYPKIEKTDKPVVGDILDNLGIHRYCCRRMFLGHLPLVDKIENPYANDAKVKWRDNK
jgi:DNA-directed RNA polymerase subunit N (RpoN/RPB10)